MRIFRSSNAPRLPNPRTSPLRRNSSTCSIGMYSRGRTQGPWTVGLVRVTEPSTAQEPYSSRCVTSSDAPPASAEPLLLAAFLRKDAEGEAQTAMQEVEKPFSYFLVGFARANGHEFPFPQRVLEDLSLPSLLAACGGVGSDSVRRRLRRPDCLGAKYNGRRKIPPGHGSHASGASGRSRRRICLGHRRFDRFR